jgi:hypothetical protein
LLFASSFTHPLALALTLRLPSLLASADHLHPPSSSSELRVWSSVTPSSCSSNFELEPLEDDAKRTHFPSRRLPPTTPPSTSDPAMTVGRTARATRLTYATPQPPMSTCPRRRQALHRHRVPRRCPVATVSAPPSNHPQSVPRGPVVLLGNTLPSSSPPAGRIQPAKAPATKGKSSSLFWSHGPKGSSGPGHFSWLGRVPME